MPASPSNTPRSTPFPYPNLLQVSIFFALVMAYKASLSFLPFFLRGVSGMILLESAYVALPLLLVLTQRRSVATVFRLRPVQGGQWLQSVWLGLLTFALSQGLFVVVQQLAVLLGAHLSDPNGAVHQVALPLQLAVFALLPAFAEEWSFRGFVLSGALRLPPAAAAIFTGILFGALHGSFLRFVPLVLLGVIWSQTALRTDSLLPGLVGHLMNNALALLLAALSSPTEGAQGLHGLGLLLAGAALAALGAWGIRPALRRLGPLPTESPARPWAAGEQQFWIPLAVGMFLFLLFGLSELSDLWS